MPPECRPCEGQPAGAAPARGPELPGAVPLEQTPVLRRPSNSSRLTTPHEGDYAALDR
jgi:hypothetical protein